MFITVEGPEGAGKSTAVRELAGRLRARGIDVLTTREPGAGAFGTAIREVLLHGEAMPPRAELFLFLADRANHVERIIRPALAAGKWVLCDRFADSTRVYQVLVRGLDGTFVNLANRFATDGLTPDLTFLLDIDPEIGLSRIRPTGRAAAPDRIDREPLEFHRAVGEGFRRLAAAEPSRWRIVDASRPPGEVVAEIERYLFK